MTICPGARNVIVLADDRVTLAPRSDSGTSCVTTQSVSQSAAVQQPRTIVRRVHAAVKRRRHQTCQLSLFTHSILCAAWSSTVSALAVLPQSRRSTAEFWTKAWTWNLERLAPHHCGSACDDHWRTVTRTELGAKYCDSSQEEPSGLSPASGSSHGGGCHGHGPVGHKFVTWRGFDQDCGFTPADALFHPHSRALW